MFEHVLVPVDFSEKNKRALAVAVEIASLSHGKITLLHVIETVADTSFSEFEDFYKALESRSTGQMDVLIDPYRDCAVRLEERITYGNRTQEILRCAETHQVDLIIMSSHKVDIENLTVGWGTISHKVSILAPCPIMLVK